MNEETKDKKPLPESVMLAYGNDEEEAKYAQSLIQGINKDLEKREQHTAVFNGLPYSKSYVYNQRKAINYAPPRSKGEREVSLGIVHEKIVAFAAFFLKYVFKRRFRCYDENGQIVQGMGEIYNLGVEHSYQMEKLKRKIALIYWETFSQGDAFILEEWSVKNRPQVQAIKDGKPVTPDTMDYTYEFIDNLEYKEAEMIQERMAISRLLDGRMVILGNPEQEETQEQPRITIEEVISATDAEQVFGSLKRWAAVPKTKTDIDVITGERVTLFDTERNDDPTNQFVVHYCFDKPNNRFNVFVNGLMMFSRKTPLTLFYPRGNYPVSAVHSERLTGSAYSRSVPAKTKFNADFVDWALKMLAEKFEQGVDPALLVKGKYTLTKDLFKGGQRTHGVSKSDYEKADPDNNGITSQEFNFVTLLKEIVESQTLNSTTTGEIADQSTATAVNAAQSNQIEKLGFLLDGIVNGFADMALRRAETIEAKYTMKKKETIVDGKRINVYQDFTVSMGGANHSVMFDDEPGSETFDEEASRDELFEKAHKEKTEGFNNEYYKVNPSVLKNRRYTLDVEIIPERRKDTYLQIMELREDFAFLLGTFGNMMNLDKLKKEYLDVSGRPAEIFLPGDAMRLNEMLNQAGTEAPAQPNTGSFGRPKVGETMKLNGK